MDKGTGVGRLLLSVLGGLGAGFLVMFIFQMITPSVELAYLSYAGVAETAEYPEALSASFLMKAYYVASWSITVFMPALLATWISRHHRRLTGLVCGGVFFVILLVNPELIREQLATYLAFVVFGAIALVLPAKLFKAV